MFHDTGVIKKNLTNLETSSFRQRHMETEHYIYSERLHISCHWCNKDKSDKSGYI